MDKDTTTSPLTEEERMELEEVPGRGFCEICNETFRSADEAKYVYPIGHIHWWHSTKPYVKEQLVGVNLKSTPYGYDFKTFLSFVPDGWNEAEVQKHFEGKYGDNLLGVEFSPKSSATLQN